MRTGAPLAALALLAACSPSPPSGQGLPRAALEEAIARAVGDPSTCVLLADRATGRIVFRYGESSTCNALRPACDRPGNLKPADTLRLIAQGPRMISCPSASEGRRVGWAAGPVAGTRALNYAAVMDSDRALPGREIAARLAEAFRNAGI